MPTILPAYKKRKGAYEMRANSGLYIEKLDLADALRFTKRPSEMIRRLLTHLVGSENLKQMVPIGNKNRTGIPEEIRRVVFCKLIYRCYKSV